MNLSREQIELDAAATGFRPHMLEKVAHLIGILEGINRHPATKNKLALKGGTALNLFMSELPRLSVDIDLNYIGVEDRDQMLAERPLIEQALNAICQREGLALDKAPTEHAGGSYNLRYRSVYGNTESVKVDIVYMYRIPLWPTSVIDSHLVGSCQAREIVVLDEYELAAGKLCALLGRQTSRDLFDAHRLLTTRTLDRAQLRLAFVVYGAMNRRDWRTMEIDHINGSAEDAERNLVPLLSHALLPEPSERAGWIDHLLTSCRAAFDVLLPLAPNEIEFLDRLLDYGDIAPELLTGDQALQERIRKHPALAWKALNVRGHRSSNGR